MYKICKRYTFEASHRLSSAKSKDCLKIHGHSYKLEVVLKSDILNKDGMVMDFKELDEIVKPIVKWFDHNHIEQGDNVLYNPTAENMATDIIAKIREKTELLCGIRLWETEKAFVEICE